MNWFFRLISNVRLKSDHIWDVVHRGKVVWRKIYCPGHTWGVFAGVGRRKMGRARAVPGSCERLEQALVLTSRIPGSVLALLLTSWVTLGMSHPQASTPSSIKWEDCSLLESLVVMYKTEYVNTLCQWWQRKPLWCVIRAKHRVDGLWSQTSCI